MTVTATIDVSTPTGRKIVRELEKHKKIVKILNPLNTDVNGIPEKTYSVDEVFDKLRKKLEAHYKVDFDKI